MIGWRVVDGGWRAVVGAGVRPTIRCLSCSFISSLAERYASFAASCRSTCETASRSLAICSFAEGVCL